MLLSAPFCFFSPFHSKKKYHIELSLQSISSLFSYILLYSPYPHSSPSHILTSHWVSFIGYIRNLAHINITKLKRILRQIAISHKYFIYNDLLI